ncbi:hypothetical protein IW262DRAFT_1302244 [Armillaria fumosa]|nr:hypothetical protein IW262DRAFT_1302244 [Armillaria fumosa]
MAAGTYPATAIPELTNSQIKGILEDLDQILNNAIFSALLYAFNFYREWAMCIRTFTTLAWKSIWETFNLITSSTPVILTQEIWHCWIAWGRSCTVHTASRGIVAYYNAFGPLVSTQAFLLEKDVNWALLYASLIMATLLWCTILIIYRILRLGGTASRICAYQRVIELLVESALLYSVVIVVLLVFEARNEAAANYIEALAIAMRNDTQMSVGSGWGTSSTKGPDLEEGLEDITEVRVEGALPIDNNQLQSTRQSVKRKITSHTGFAIIQDHIVPRRVLSFNPVLHQGFFDQSTIYSWMGYYIYLRSYYTSSRTSHKFDRTLGAVEDAYLASGYSRWLEQPLIVGTVVSMCQIIEKEDAIWINVSRLVMESEAQIVHQEIEALMMISPSFLDLFLTFQHIA